MLFCILHIKHRAYTSSKATTNLMFFFAHNTPSPRAWFKICVCINFNNYKSPVNNNLHNIYK